MNYIATRNIHHASYNSCKYIHGHFINISMHMYYISGTLTASIFSEVSDLDATVSSSGGLSSGFGKAVSWIWKHSWAGEWGWKQDFLFIWMWWLLSFSWMVLVIVASVFNIKWGRMLWHPQISGRHICLLVVRGAPSCPDSDSTCFYDFWKGSMFWTMLRCTSVS